MRVIQYPKDLKNHIGEEFGVSEWVTVDQPMIDKFAEATGDHQWIHVDVERCKKEMPGGKTIAHGFLTLSLVPRLGAKIWKIEHRSKGINYGLNKLRFTSPAEERVRWIVGAYGIATDRFISTGNVFDLGTGIVPEVKETPLPPKPRGGRRSAAA